MSAVQRASKAKEVFSSLDMMVMSLELDSSLVGARVSNIYDIDNKTYVLKLSQSEGSAKIQLLIERGIRLHTTKYIRERQGRDMPSVFAMKLRKHLNNKRLESVRQVGMDRVCDLRFGSGEGCIHLLVELYSLGNIILADHNYCVLALLRTHKFENDVVCKEGEPYPIAYSTSVLADEGLRDTSPDAAPAAVKISQNTMGYNNEEETPMQVDNKGSKAVLQMTAAEFRAWAAKCEETYATEQAAAAAAAATSKGTRKKPKRMFVKQLLMGKEYGGGLSSLGPDVLDHCIACAGDPWARNTAVVSLNTLRSFSDDDVIETFIKCLAAGAEMYRAIRTTEQTAGYVLYDTVDNAAGRFVDFTPILLEQHRNHQYKRFETFASAIDEYFCKIEEQRLARAAALLEEQALKKVEKVKNVRTEHIASIEESQQRLAIEASLVEAHAESIDKLALVLNSAVDNGMTWDDIQLMVDEEAEGGNPIAALVVSLNLEKSKVVVRLRNFDHVDAEYDSSDNNGEDKCDEGFFVEAEVDISMSAHANASAIFKRRKLASAHYEKATRASTKAVQSVEGTVMRQLENNKLRISLKAARTKHWFEKFSWFITSEGYLVISGRSDHQTDIILKKYMQPDDVFVHTDASDAQPCVLRRGSKVQENKAKNFISPFAIHEAGNLCMCRSSAWDKKVSSSPWWAWGAQVQLTSLGAPLGRGFAVLGRRHFLPPMKMELGFGIMFCVDEASTARHVHDRKIKSVFKDDDAVSMVSEAADRYGLEREDDIYEFDEKVIQRDIEAHAQDTKTVEMNSIVGDTTATMHRKQKDNHVDKNIDMEKFEESAVQPATVGNLTSKHPRKKKLDKKKARRYAEQDDEDRELAMAALGHGDKGKKLKDIAAKRENDAQEMEKQRKRQHAGVQDYIDKQHADVLGRMHAAVAAALEDLKDTDLVQDGDIAHEELATLTELPIDKALKSVETLQQQLEDMIDADEKSESQKRSINKSALLASIMLRIRKEDKEETVSRVGIDIERGPSGGVGAGAQNSSEYRNHEAADDDGKSENKAESGRVTSVSADFHKPKGETAEPEPEQEPEPDFLKEMTLEEAADMDNVASIVGFPTEEDVIMYCIPCCGPYSAIEHLKYRVKLTPGTMKQGQVAKTVMGLFSKGSSWISEAERNVMQGLSSDEVIPTLVRNTKINMPGLQAAKGVGQKGKKGKQGKR